MSDAHPSLFTDPRVAVVTLYFRGGHGELLDDERLAEQIADDLRAAGYEGHLLGITINSLESVNG